MFRAGLGFGLMPRVHHGGMPFGGGFRGPFFGGGFHLGGHNLKPFAIAGGIVGSLAVLFGGRNRTNINMQGGYMPGMQGGYYPSSMNSGYYPGLNLSNSEDPLKGLRGLYPDYNFEMIEGKYCARLKDGSGDVITASSQQELMSKLGASKPTVSSTAQTQADEAAEVKKLSTAQQGTTGIVTDADDTETYVDSSRTRSTGSSNNGQTKLYKSGRYTITKDGQTRYYAANGKEIKKEYFEIKEGIDPSNQKRTNYTDGKYSITKDGTTFYFEANGNVTDDPTKFEEAVGIRKTCRSGRYTRTINGQTYYYAADGTRIKKEYFEKQEGQKRPNTPMFLAL